MASAITGTDQLSGSPSGYGGSNNQLTQAIQTIWSKEILFQAMPVLRFEQFAVKKTELGVQPGLTVKFMRYNNLGDASTLVEGERMETAALTASQYEITVAEKGYAVAISELLLNASFDDVMASASRLLGRNMAKFLDQQARDTLYLAGNAVYGYQYDSGAATTRSPYDGGTTVTDPTMSAASRAEMTGDFYFHLSAAKDAVETLASADIPRLGETYVCFVHPSQSRRLRDNPEWIEVTKYAAPGNFMLGEIGRINDVVYIETTQVKKVTGGAGAGYTADTGPTTGDGGSDRFDAVMIGDNAFGHAVALPVELRDGGVLDFGREHALAWYSIWGFGLITDEAVVIIETN